MFLGFLAMEYIGDSGGDFLFDVEAIGEVGLSLGDVGLKLRDLGLGGTDKSGICDSRSSHSLFIPNLAVVSVNYKKKSI